MCMEKLKKRLTSYAHISKDFLLTLFSSVISVGTMQLILYPFLARQFTTDEYGNILTYIGGITVIVHTLGNELAQARLVQNRKYIAQKLSGDFNIMLVGVLVVAFIATAVVCISVWSIKGITLVLLMALAALMILKQYNAVSFRLKLDFKKILILNVVSALGYIVGIVLVWTLNYWALAFLTAEIAGLLYLWRSSSLYREPFAATPLFGDSARTFLYFGMSGLVGNISTYFDRFLINPLLGAGAVSVFYTASYLAKTLSLLTNPATTVLLSYIAKDEKNISRKNFLFGNVIILAISAFFLLAVIVIGPYITAFLYPTLVDAARPLITGASAATVLGIAASFSRVFVLRYAPSYWTALLSAIKLSIYVVLGIIFIKHGGLQGFCYAVLLNNIVSFALSFCVANHYIRKQSDLYTYGTQKEQCTSEENKKT